MSSRRASLAEIVNDRQAGRYARRGAESIAQPARQNSSRGARFGVKPVRRLRPHGEPRVKTVVITDEDLEKAKVQGSQFIAIRESRHRTGWPNTGTKASRSSATFAKSGRRDDCRKPSQTKDPKTSLFSCAAHLEIACPKGDGLRQPLFSRWFCYE